ncbi:MAG: tetratricopeptide repeat protein [Marinicaulis sp.]|nr:tetratricopeptide repeat protein [Marinicaulis sp.]
MADQFTQYKAGLASAQVKITDGQFGAALAILSDILHADPTLADALYMKAVCERYLTNWDEAALTLDKLKAASPEFGRAYQEEGHLYRAMGNESKALHAYQHACQLNPALEASWRAQGDILNSLGRDADARKARGQADHLAHQPKEVLAVSNFIYEGKLLKAEKLCRAFLKKYPRHVEAMRLLADLGVRFSVFDDAEFLLESAIEFEPDNIQLRLDYLKVLRKRQKYGEAYDRSRALYEKHPRDPVFQSQYAVDCMHTGNFEDALALFEDILRQMPDDAPTLVSRGHALKTYGRSDDAVMSYQAAYRVRRDLGDAYYGLANLKTYRFSDEEVRLMREQEAGGRLTYASRIQLCFSLGKALEDREEFEAAFGYYERGNDLKRAQCRYDADQMTAELKTQAQACTKEHLERQGNKGHPASDPIFIVGLPRAGSTLLEQILASHSQVDGTFELPNILAMAHRLRRGKRADGSSSYPLALSEIAPEQLSELGRKYIDDTRIHRGGAPFFIDKMPNNFRHIGLIRLILPNAKIIDARREPMACCFSGFKQLFAEGQEFTYGLEQIGRYYRDYVELMRHWDDVLPEKILRVQHEDVLDDLDGEVRRMLDFCELPFETACLEFHKTDRSVRTASSEQVRKPINKSGVDQWRPFKPHLGPLKQALGPALTEYRA